jgi:hypothetical protein
MNDKSKSKWYWRVLRWGLITLAVLVTLVAVLVTEENWRGKRDWEAYQRGAEARGDRLDVASVVPPAVPDEQNFFCAPIVASAFESSHNTNAVNRLNFNIWRGGIASQITERRNWQKAELTDLKQWQTAFRNFSTTLEGRTNGFPVAPQPQTPAADVLLALSVFDPALEELRAASQRPYARIPLNYEDDFGSAGELLPWLAIMKGSAQFLELRSLAELQNNQSGLALADVKLLLRVTDCIREQPFLISHLVRMAMMAYVVQPIYEGLARHAWTDAQIAELEQALGREDFLADYQFAIHSEKAFAIDTFEKQRITREIKSVDDSSGTNRIITISLRWTPAAYFYETELSVAQLDDRFLRSLVDMTNRMVSPKALDSAQADLRAQARHYSLYKIQALSTASAIANAVKKFTMVQAQVDLARVACALERYRLANGHYPAKLEELAPQFIGQMPHDVINGQPLHYRLREDGDFVVYSVGWNEKDNGGTVVLGKNGTVDRDNGDWVWQNPAK